MMARGSMRTTASMSAISARTTDTREGLPRAFATLRFSGDRLDPDGLTHLLGTRPTLAYRKGEAYRRDPSGRVARGRTGVWYLSTRKAVRGSELSAHLRYLVGLITPAGDPGRLNCLRDLILNNGLEADVSCFWHGAAKAGYPSIPRFATEFFAKLPARIETDFATD